MLYIYKTRVCKIIFNANIYKKFLSYDFILIKNKKYMYNQYIIHIYIIY